MNKLILRGVAFVAIVIAVSICFSSCAGGTYQLPFHETELFSDVYNGHTVKVIQRGPKSLGDIYTLKIVVDGIEQCKLLLSLRLSLETGKQMNGAPWIFPSEYITGEKYKTTDSYVLRFGDPDFGVLPSLLCDKNFNSYSTSGMYRVTKINKNIQISPSLIGI